MMTHFYIYMKWNLTHNFLVEDSILTTVRLVLGYRYNRMRALLA